MGFKYRLVVFDFDGVILDSVRILFIFFDYYRQACEMLGQKFPDLEFFKQNWGLPASVLMKKNFTKEDVAILWSYMHKAETILWHKPAYCGDVLETVKRLRAENIKTAILTNRAYSSLKKHIGGISFFEENFEMIVGLGRPYRRVISNFYGNPCPKPDARSFKKIFQLAERHGIQKNEILMIGDTQADKEAAENAGVDFIAVLSGALDTKKHWLALGVPGRNIVSDAGKIIDIY